MKKVFIIGAVVLAAFSSLAFTPILSVPATVGSVLGFTAVTAVAHEEITQPRRPYGPNGEVVKIGRRICRIAFKHC